MVSSTLLPPPPKPKRSEKMSPTEEIAQFNKPNRTKKTPNIQKGMPVSMNQQDMDAMYLEHHADIKDYNDSIDQHTNVIYDNLPTWADPSSPEYNPVKFLAEWSKGPHKFIRPNFTTPEETKELNWFQKLLFFFGLGDSANKVKIEQIKSDERIRLKELEIKSTISKDCKNEIHQCDDWKYSHKIDIYGNGTRYPIRFDRIYTGTCTHCKSPVIKKLSE